MKYLTLVAWLGLESASLVKALKLQATQEVLELGDGEILEPIRFSEFGDTDEQLLPSEDAYFVDDLDEFLYADDDESVIASNEGLAAYPSRHDNYNTVTKDRIGGIDSRFPFESHDPYGAYNGDFYFSSHEPEPSACTGCGDYDVSDCVNGCQTLRDIHIVAPARGEQVQNKVSEDTITIRAETSDSLSDSIQNSAHVVNGSGMSLSSNKGCGSGSVEKTFTISGYISVDEEISRHEASGHRSCEDARYYSASE